MSHDVVIFDEAGKPRDTESILEAIEVMGKVLVNPLKHDPMIVVMAPTICNGLRELLERREEIHRAKADEVEERIAQEGRNDAAFDNYSKQILNGWRQGHIRKDPDERKSLPSTTDDEALRDRMAKLLEQVEGAYNWRDQVSMVENAYNWREGGSREDLHQWLRKFAIDSGQRLVVQFVAGWIKGDMAKVGPGGVMKGGLL